MSKFENILFDFDGTLFDTSQGVMKSFEKVAIHYKLKVSEADYRRMMGPPLEESFLNILHLPKTEIQNAIMVYRRYYTEKGIFELEMYPGVHELLEKLKQDGKKLFVATSKPEIFARKILAKLQMMPLFNFVGGADEAENSRVKKADVIRYVIQRNDLQSEHCLMVGDRSYDILGAKEAGVFSCAVLWGFGEKAEFVASGANYIVSTPPELKALISHDGSKQP